MTLCANNAQEAIEKLTLILTQNNPSLNSQDAKAIILNAFDIIITTSKDELGRRKISTISEINLSSEDNFIKNIFETDYLHQHKSLGIIPLFYEDIKNNSLPISDNIFNLEYKHTYHKGLDENSQYNKKANIDILKKFKKELPTPNAETSEEAEKEEPSNEPSEIQISQEELMQKAQEKFDELKKNAQMQGEFELRVQDFEENNDENL